MKKAEDLFFQKNFLVTPLLSNHFAMPIHLTLKNNHLLKQSQFLLGTWPKYRSLFHAIFWHFEGGVSPIWSFIHCICLFLFYLCVCLFCATSFVGNVFYKKLDFRYVRPMAYKMICRKAKKNCLGLEKASPKWLNRNIQEEHGGQIVLFILLKKNSYNVAVLYSMTKFIINNHN